MLLVEDNIDCQKLANSSRYGLAVAEHNKETTKKASNVKRVILKVGNLQITKIHSTLLETH